MSKMKKEIEQELQEISPFVNNFLQQQKSEVPDNYFEELEQNLLAKTVLKNQTRKNTVIKKWSVISLSAAAAIAFIFFGLNYFNHEEMQMKSFDEQLAALSYDDISSIIENNIEEFDTKLFFETEFVDTKTVHTSMSTTLHQQIMNSNPAILEQPKEEINLDEEILNTIEDSSIKEYLLDESLMNDFGL